MASYMKGSVVRVSVALVNSSGTAVDPSVLQFKYEVPPAAAVTKQVGIDSELVKDSVGNYHIDLTVSTAGQWLYRWAATGTNAAAVEGGFTVDPGSF